MRGSAYEKARHPHSWPRRCSRRSFSARSRRSPPDGEDGAEESSTIDFLSYEEAVTYFDFDTAASNWCTNFGMDPTVSLEEAKAAILHGTDRELVIRLATFARDVGYGDEKLIVTNAFRPACYQEVIGLHDSNANTGPFRRALLWNGRSVTNFWWDAETAPGWPEDYAIDLSAYDIQTLDLRYYYRAALRLWVTPGQTATTPAPDAAATTPATRWIYRTTGSGRISKRATPTPRPASCTTWRTMGFISRSSPRRRPRVKRGTSRPRRRCSRSAITTTPFSPATRSCTRSIITRRCAAGRWRTGAECTSARASRYCRLSSAAAGCSRKNTSPATSAPKPTRPCAPSSRSRGSWRTASRAAARSMPCSAKSRAPATRPRPS